MFGLKQSLELIFYSWALIKFQHSLSLYAMRVTNFEPKVWSRSIDLVHIYIPTYNTVNYVFHNYLVIIYICTGKIYWPELANIPEELLFHDWYWQIHFNISQGMATFQLHSLELEQYFSNYMICLRSHHLLSSGPINGEYESKVLIYTTLRPHRWSGFSLVTLLIKFSFPNIESNNNLFPLFWFRSFWLDFLN